MADTYLNHIDDKWVPAATGETFLDTNPARPDEVVGELPRSGPDDVDAVGSGHATVDEVSCEGAIADTRGDG